MTTIATPLPQLAADAPVDLPPTQDGESALFWDLRRRVTWTTVLQAFRTAPLRVYLLLILTVVFWVALFWMFAEGFDLLRTAINNASWQARTVQTIYNVFFTALSAMLVVSSAIILYSGLYRSEEVTFLLTTPARPERIVLYKFQEAVVFSCWGFLLLGSPMLIAYGVVSESPWYYYALLLPFLVSFVYIPAGVGAILCMIVVYFLPTIRIHVLVVAGLALLAGLLAAGWIVLAGSDDNAMTPTWFHDVISRLSVTEQRFLPSWWLSSGLLEAAHPATIADADSVQESLWFLAVLGSNALLAHLAVGWIGGALFRTSYSRLQDVDSPPATVTPHWIDRLLLAVTGWLPEKMQHLLVKDLRIFRRDPVQWTQAAIFFGLLSLFFFNIKRFQYEFAWMNVIGYLNLAVVGLILATFTTRFIFPMVSLEGRRFWILGTLPIERDAVVWSKFLFAVVGSVLPCSLLVLLSDIALQVFDHSPLVALLHQITCWTLCVGLSAIAVGLGARLPDFKESSPSKIAAGFGGTLNLVLSSIFIIVTVMVTAVPVCAWVEAQRRGTDVLLHSAWAQWLGLGSLWSVVVGIVLTLLIGVFATWLPIRIGLDAFRKMEF